MHEGIPTRYTMISHVGSFDVNSRGMDGGCMEKGSYGEQLLGIP